MLDSTWSDRLNNLMAKGSIVISSARDRGDPVHPAPFAEWRSQSLSCLTALLGTEHVYTQSFKRQTEVRVKANAEEGLGILRAVHQDLAFGYLTTSLRELVHAELFVDFLEMAEHLLTQGYKDPAAVLVGGVLEERLRQLCRKNGIATDSLTSDGTKPKKADAMNSDLTKAGVYDKLNQKNVTAWLDLRNKSAHGLYSEYDTAQVAQLLSGVRDFTARFPA